MNAEQPIGQDQGHAPDTTSVRGVVYAGIALLILLVLSVAFIAGLAWLWLDEEEPSPWQQMSQFERRPPDTGPGPHDDMPEIRRRLRDQQLQRINTRGWVDPQQNIARIPIEEAMERIANRGLPDFSADRPSSTPTGQPDATSEPGARSAGEVPSSR